MEKRIVPLAGLLALALCFACGNQPSPKNETENYSGELPAEWYRAPQEISLAGVQDGQPELTRNFYFILDGSDSMTENTNNHCGGDQRFQNKMSGAVWALEQFLKTVPDDVRIGLYVFDRHGEREAVSLGLENREEFIRAVHGVRPGNGTPLAGAIKFGTRQLVRQYKQQLGYGEYRLVVITDGEAYEIPDAAIYAAQFGIPIYTIGLCVGENHPLRRFSVSYRAADNFADLASGLSETLAESPSFDTASFESLP